MLMKKLKEYQWWLMITYRARFERVVLLLETDFLMYICLCFFLDVDWLRIVSSGLCVLTDKLKQHQMVVDKDDYFFPKHKNHVYIFDSFLPFVRRQLRKVEIL